MYSTVPSSSRLFSGPAPACRGDQSFGEISNFLRSALADEDSRLFSDSIGEVAMHAESVVAGLRANRQRDAVAPLLMDMLTVLREHRSLVANLGLAWRGLYEYAAYLQSLNSFRVLIGEWLLRSRPRDDELEVSAEDFALVAWRTMGDGMLLVDMYEQWREREEGASVPGESGEPQADRARQWWQRLRR